jgi:type I restriction-modification system DNA methylase subunit
MTNKGDETEKLALGYKAIYQSFGDLRESFHRTGRLDDSNAKLDEVSKLFATYLSFKRGLIDLFPDVSEKQLVAKLQAAFIETAHLDQYKLQTGRSIFGETPSLALRDEDKDLTKQLVEVVVEAIDLAFELRQGNHAFDLLNEAFGHFVRDNFRSNVEDAQYMTPPEVVEFMVGMVMHDLKTDNKLNSDSKLVFCDPTCGVGSFLTSTYEYVGLKKNMDPHNLVLVGQDKVERMVRLATINLALADVDKHEIFIGNSLSDEAPINKYSEMVDVILTNPPFGARFPMSIIQSEFKESLRFFGKAIKSGSTIDSELLFIDRDLKLLKDGGYMLIVVPDGVVSAKGISATFRQYLSSEIQLKAIIELPPTTFAQAGTRTKTTIVYLQKTKAQKKSSVFMAVVKDLGFQVSSRKGVQVKVPSGKNDLQDVLKAYISATGKGRVEILNEQPSCVMIPMAEVLEGSWTPNHYSASRLQIIQDFNEGANFNMTQLSELTKFGSDIARPVKAKGEAAFISILHVLGEGFVDIAGALTYKPKTPGFKVSAGDILISKINPRIPRVCIVPDFGKPTYCSTEFEIIIPNKGVNPMLIAYLLLTDVAQKQIVSLTSGTSSSHNRIRSSELANVLLPIPQYGSDLEKTLLGTVKEYGEAISTLTTATLALSQIRMDEVEILKS